MITCVQTYPSPSTVAVNSCSGYTFLYDFQLLLGLVLPFNIFLNSIIYEEIKQKYGLPSTSSRDRCDSSTCARGPGLQSCIMLTDQQLTCDLAASVCVRVHMSIYTPIYVRRSKVSPCLTVRPPRCCANIKDEKKKKELFTRMPLSIQSRKPPHLAE